jgi:hypothetical protein
MNSGVVHLHACMQCPNRLEMLVNFIILGMVWGLQIGGMEEEHDEMMCGTGGK